MPLIMQYFIVLKLVRLLLSFCIILPIFSCLSKKRNKTPKPNKTPKNPLGWVFFKKTRFFEPWFINFQYWETETGSVIFSYIKVNMSYCSCYQYYTVSQKWSQHYQL